MTILVPMLQQMKFFLQQKNVLKLPSVKFMLYVKPTIQDIVTLVDKQTIFASNPQYASVQDASKEVRTVVLKMIQKARR